jgi:hypothetical protein
MSIVYNIIHIVILHYYLHKKGVHEGVHDFVALSCVP